MIKHYITLAIRNLLKYKSQSLISIIGLAIGFTCFALSTLWIRYEQKYDAFHEGAERMYLVRTESNTSDNGLNSINPQPLAGYLKETFPEIEAACNVEAWGAKVKYKGIEYSVPEMNVDSVTMDFFGLKLLSGTTSFMNTESDECAVTERFAKQLFGDINPIGQEVVLGFKACRVGAVISSWGKHTNIPFDIVCDLRANSYRDRWSASLCQTMIKLKKGTDAETFSKKLYEHKYITPDNIHIIKIVMTPITAMRYDRPSQEVTVKYEHIFLFALAGGLVILCSLFNYLTLFVTRIRIRGKEIALRKACGSSDRNLLMLFSVEYLITLFISILTGMVLLELILPTFKELSDIQSSDWNIYLETVTYSGGVACLSFLLSLYPIYYFRRSSLNMTLKGVVGGKSKTGFQQVCMILQLIISTGFIFCSVLLMKQVHHLNHTDLGRIRTGVASIAVYPEIEGLYEEVGKIPYITDRLPKDHFLLFPRNSRSFQTFNQWEGKQDSTASLTLETIECDQVFFNFYELQLIKGTLPADGSDQILINETAAKAMNINFSAGKTLGAGKSPISGIVKDFYIAPPTIPVKPMMFTFRKEDYKTSDIIFKYKEDSWEICKTRIEKLIKKMDPNVKFYRFYNMEEEYLKFLKSENALLKMLDFVTLVCILISLFGVFSLVTLDCQQHRKSIAVRKVNGAVTWQIMQSFYVRYVLLLCIASVIAFPVGYLIMKRWIENYVLQTSIDFWIYPAIWLSLLILILLCTGWRIWKAANQNPAEVIKSE